MATITQRPDDSYEYFTADEFRAVKRAYKRDSGYFSVGPDTFERLREKLSSAHSSWRPREQFIDACLAELFLACPDLPLRRVGTRLFAWDGTVWTDETLGVLGALRAYLRAPAVLNQYTLDEPQYEGEFRSHHSDGTIEIYAGTREWLPDDVVKQIGEWYQHPERALRALDAALPVERDDRNELLHEDRRGWLNTPNATYDLATGERVTDDAKRRSLEPLHVTKTDIGTLTDCPKFLAALERALPDPDVRDYFQRLIGYMATGNVTEDVVVWCFGEGRSGKTTIVGAIQEALGTYAAERDQTAILRVSLHFPNLDGLRGKRLAVLAEMDKAHQVHTGRLKQLSGGNRVPGARGTEGWYPQFTLVVECNEMPHLGDTSRATQERLRVIPFNEFLPLAERIEGLRDYIKQHETRGVLAWVLEGARKYYTDGGLKRIPAGIERATNDVIARDDPERVFYANLLPSTTALDFGTLYDALDGTCRRAGKPTPSRRDVSAELKARGFVLKRGHGNRMKVLAALAEAA